MLIWSHKGRAAAGTLAVVLFVGFFFLPLSVILMSSLSQQWNGLLPSDYLRAFCECVSRSGLGFAVLKPGGGVLRQLVRVAVWHVGGAVSAPVQRPAAKIPWSGVLSSQRDSFRVGGVRDSGGFQSGTAKDEWHFLDCTGGPLCPDFGIYL